MKQDLSIRPVSQPGRPPAMCAIGARRFFVCPCPSAPRFARPEPRLRALAYLQGILSETVRKTAGNWLNKREKSVLTGCNVCSLAPSGTPMASVMICVAMCLSNWACSRLSWSSTKAAFPSVANNRLGLACSIAEDHWSGRELSGRCLSLVCDRQRT